MPLLIRFAIGAMLLSVDHTNRRHMLPDDVLTDQPVSSLAMVRMNFAYSDQEVGSFIVPQPQESLEWEVGDSTGLRY